MGERESTPKLPPLVYIDGIVKPNCNSEWPPPNFRKRFFSFEFLNEIWFFVVTMSRPEAVDLCFRSKARSGAKIWGSEDKRLLGKVWLEFRFRSSYEYRYSLFILCFRIIKFAQLKVYSLLIFNDITLKNFAKTFTDKLAFHFTLQVTKKVMFAKMYKF